MLARADFVAACAARDLGAVLKLAKQWGGVGFTASHLARRCEFTVSRVQDYISGRVQARQVEIFERVADGLHIPGAMFDLAARPWEGGSVVNAVGSDPAATGASAVGSGDEEADAERRVVLQGLAVAGLAVAGCPAAEPDGWSIPCRIGPDHVADVVDTTQVYRQWVSRHGGAAVRRHVGLLLKRAAAMVPRSGTSAVRRDLLVAVGDVANLGAYVARDLGHSGDARHYYQLSLSAAHAGDHIGLGTHAIVRMAGHYIELRQPDQVLIHLQAARSRAGDHLAAGDLANQWCIEAWAHAQTGNIQATQRAIGLAEEAFTRVTVDDAPRAPWAAQHVTEAELYSLTGAALVDLAHHQPNFAESATERLHRALTLRNPSATRNRILDRVSLAEAYLTAGELNQAAQAAVLALDGVEDIASVRLLTRLRTLQRSLALYAHGEPSAIRAELREMNDQLRALEQRVPTSGPDAMP